MTLACLSYGPRMSAIRQRFSPKVGASSEVGASSAGEFIFSPEDFEDLVEVFLEVVVV